MVQDNRSWKITFKGEVLPGLNRDVVRKDCVHLLKLPVEKVDRMFSGRSITLRKGLDKARLEKYTVFFQRCGLHIHIVEEKDALSLVSDEGNVASAPSESPLPLQPLGLVPMEESATPDNNDEIFAQRTLLSTHAGNDSFYDALIRKTDSNTFDIDQQRGTRQQNIPADNATAQLNNSKLSLEPQSTNTPPVTPPSQQQRIPPRNTSTTQQSRQQQSNNQVRRVKSTQSRRQNISASDSKIIYLLGSIVAVIVIIILAILIF